MMARTHLLFGGTLAFFAAEQHVLPHEPLIYVAGLFGSLLPDIDHPKSTFGRRVPFLSIPIAKIFGHRGITHSAFIVIAFLGAWFYYHGQVSPIILALALGYISHLLGDFCFGNGIPLLYPIQKRFRMPLSAKVDSWLESLVAFALLLWLGWMLLGSPPLMPYVDQAQQALGLAGLHGS